MKKLNVLKGQLDLFNMPVQETIKPKEEKIIDKPKIETDNFSEIIEHYKHSCSRIVKRIHGALLVGFEDKIMCFNNSGKHEFDLVPNVGLMPGDEILIVNKDIELNDIQLSKLAIMDPAQYIKRKGDANIIIPMPDKTVVVNPRGWVIEWEQKPIYKEDEVISRIKEIITQDEMLNVGDTVKFIYGKENHTGKIASIYNNGETVNVTWEDKHTAFYYRCVRKIA